jgi:protein O-GlcNAc transferase
MGVPVITLAGQRYVERISASKLTALGLQELIAGSRQEYLDKAVSLALDPAHRSELRAGLRNRMARSPLCDGPGLARAMESAYRTMWAHNQSGIPDAKG